MERLHEAAQAEPIRVYNASVRRAKMEIPAEKKFVCSSMEKVDPAKQLREAGYPFDHISTELTTLHGNFVVVSQDVAALRETITKEGETLSKKVDDSREAALKEVGH